MVCQVMKRTWPIGLAAAGAGPLQVELLGALQVPVSGGGSDGGADGGLTQA